MELKKRMLIIDGAMFQERAQIEASTLKRKGAFLPLKKEWRPRDILE